MKKAPHIHMRAALVFALVMIMSFAVACGEVVSRNPLLTPPVMDSYIQTEDEFVNILLLGIDYGGETFRTSGGKPHKLEESHTDGVIVVALNKTQGTINMISIPRDSLTYVPGIRGIYKFNGAVNCGDSVEEGCELACQAASWHLGGIEIHNYVAIDATALAALGDAIGGVDFKMDTGFQGLQRWYDKGETYHLDGQGIMDYMRARKSANTEDNDIGRTKRQRRMLMAIFAKVKKNPSLVMDLLKVYQSGELNIFTDLGVMDIMKLVPAALGLDLSNMETHVLTGDYLIFMKCFTFNDQEHRQKVIRDVYGVDVPEMPYVSYEYTKFLTEAGLTTAKFINMSRDVLEHARTIPGAQDTEEYKALDAAIDAVVMAFDRAADSYDAAYTKRGSEGNSGTQEEKAAADADVDAMIKARNAMKPAVEKAARAFDYPEEIKWSRLKYWYRDRQINEIGYDWS